MSNKTKTTQTEIRPQRNVQVQANVQLSRTAVRPIKQEIAMPNIANSSGQAQSKKRKISSMSRSTSMSTTSESFDLASTMSVATNTENVSNSVQSEVDESILNSEVYKIYCQNEDPAEAMRKINELKNCVSFEEQIYKLPGEEGLKRGFDNALKKLWALGTSKYDSVKKYLNGEISNHSLFNAKVALNEGSFSSFNATVFEVITKCFTRITLLLPDGFEYWYIKNYTSGSGVSKWYRGTSASNQSSGTSTHQNRNTALLNIIGVSNSMITKLHYEHYVSKHFKTVQWFDFAHDIAMYDLDIVFPGMCVDSSFYIKELKTDKMIEVKAILRFYIRRYEYHSGYGYSDSDYSNGISIYDSYDCVFGWDTFNHRDRYVTYKRYHGESTRPVKKTRRPKNEKEIMVIEAKKAALKEFFKDCFGITKFNDIRLDELHRCVEAVD